MNEPSQCGVPRPAAKYRPCLALLLLTGAVLGGGWAYLNSANAIGLGGDEAYYWLWSRRLDFGYYEKGPMVAWLIRASCALRGETMPAVRLPALLLVAGSLVVACLLASRISRRPVTGLAVALLMTGCPIIAAGGLLISPDTPQFFFWGLTCLLWHEAIFARRTRAWYAAGVCLGLGLLSKLSVCALPVGLVLFLATSPAHRSLLRSRYPWISILLGLAFLSVDFAWNAAHEFTAYRYLWWQLSSAERDRLVTARLILSPIGYVLGSAAVINPVYVPGIVAAVAKSARMAEPAKAGAWFCVCMAVPIWLVGFMLSPVANVLLNWPSPAYFTLMVLFGLYLADRFANEPARRRRIVIEAVVAWAVGICVLVTALGFHRLAGPLESIRRRVEPDRPMPPLARVDPMAARFRVAPALAREVDGIRRRMPRPDRTFIFSRHYMRSSLMAFYLADQPFTYCAPRPLSPDPKQFGLWPGLEQPALIGQDAIYLGGRRKAVEHAFQSVEWRDISLYVGGRPLSVETVGVCRGFKGPGGLKE